MITITPDVSIDDALQKMQSNFIKHVIVEVNDKPVGIVTERDIDKFLENSKTVSSLEDISVEQVMEKNVITITNGASNGLSHAAERMHIFKIGSVITVDIDGNLTGMITKTDVTKVYGEVYSGKFKVKDFMSRKVFTCRESDSLKLALNMINENGISRLVVTNNIGKPIGIITSNTFLVHRSYFTKDKSGTQRYGLSMDSENLCVGDLVKNEILSVNLEDDLAVAAQKMIKNHIHGMPVIDDTDKLVGIVSNSDIVRAFVKVPLNEELLEEYSKSY